MGQCVSSRSEKGVLARSKGAPPTKNPFKHRHIKMDKGKQQQSAANAHTRGEAMSFGFKRPTTAHAQLPAATPAPAAASDEKKELSSVDSLVMQQNCTARSGTPRLARPKKDATGNSNTRTNRFGFRNTTPLSNKVADSQKSDTSSLYINNYADNSHSRTDSKSSVVKLSSNRSTASSDSARSASSLSDDNHSSSRASSKGGAKSQPQPSATRFTLLTSHLPRPQFPVRLAASAAHYKSPDKSAKTAANNYTARKAAHSDNGNGSSASSTTDADSGTGSQKNGDLDAHGITTLEESPSAKNKLRKKSRPMEMVFLNNEKKTFELRELQDSIEVTEIVPLELPVSASGSGRIVQERGGFVQERGGIVQERARAYQQASLQPQLQQQQLFSSDEEESDEGFDDEGCGEEKQHRDRLLSEKVERSNCLGGGEGDADELWGHGEAMIGEDDLSNPSSGENNGEDIDKMNPPLRSVLLKIEDPAFATLAAMSTSTMLEDETSPDFSSSPPSSTADLGLELTQPTVQLDKKNNSGGSPESPGTPTHASNSLSLSEGRGDFLIDDEIADQPGLVFDETVTANSSANTIMPNSNETTPIVMELPPKTTGRIGQLSHDSPAHHNSVGTLSPCESITSDDLMIDYNPSEASSFDDINVDRRLEMTGLSEIEEAALRSDIEAIKNDEVLKEWSSRLSLGMGNGVRATHFLRSRVGSTGSGGGGGDSPRSLPLDTPRLRGSPLRPSRQGNSSPGEDFSEDSGIRLDRTTHQDMFQDVISIKTMLLRLTRVLQETDQVNAFENSLNNGYYNLGNEGSQEDVTSQKKEIADEISDLKRQVGLVLAATIGGEGAHHFGAADPAAGDPESPLR